MVFVEKRVILLEGVLGRDHKPDLIQIGFLQKMLGDDEMTVVYGIERPKIKTYFHN
jgi:hypothetical protein